MLRSREYKSVLSQEPFAVADLRPVIDRFLAEQLRPAAELHLGGQAADEMTRKGFNLDKERTVRFLDTADGALGRVGVIVRLRRDLGRTGSPWELSVKLRSPDLLAVLDAGAEEIEEDIVPLVARDGKDRVLLNDPRSMRSLFSQAVKVVDSSGDALPATVREICVIGERLGPGFAIATRGIDPNAPLITGTEITERVFRCPGIDIEDGKKLRFDLTSWRRAGHELPLTELSYRLELADDGEPAPEAVRQAMALFLAVQDLAWADPRGDTKSNFALG